MAELCPLGMAGRAAGVHLYGAMLRRDRQPPVALRLTGKPIGIARPGTVRAVECDDPANRFQIVRHLFDNGIEIGADKQQFCARVLDNVGHLLRREPEIDRHQHHIGLGGAEPEIEKIRRVF